MELTTRCPRCGTVFPAHLEQLQLRKGYIRCVNCAHIFDGYEAVVEADGDEPASASDVSSGIEQPPRLEAAEPPPALEFPTPSVLRQRNPTSARADKETNRPTGPTLGTHGAVLRPSTPVARQEPVIGQSPKSVSDLGPTFHTGPAASEIEPPTRFTVGAHPHETTPSPTDTRFHIGEPVADIGHGHRLGEPRVPNWNPSVSTPAHAAAPSVPDEADETVLPLPDEEPPVLAPRRPRIVIEPRADRDVREPMRPAPAAAPTRPWTAWLWLTLVLIATAVLVFQLAYVYRAQLANRYPAFRPMLERMCSQMDCEVPYARDIERISIMSSSLRAGQTGAQDGAANQAAQPPGSPPRAQGAPDEDMMTLQFTLRNTLNGPQEWPTMVLSLTDFSGTLVVRKNLPPEVYLSPDVLDEPFPAGGEVSVSLPIALNGQQVNGYQLGKFFQ